MLTTLQGDVRADLQTFLNQFGNALDQVRRRRGLPGALPLLARRLPLHVAGQRGVPRHRAGRPPGRHPRARPGRQRPRPQRGGAAGPGHEPRDLHRLLRRRGPGARPGDRGAARGPARRRARLRDPQRLVPAAARLCPRGAARRALDAGDARRFDPVRQPGPRAGLRARAARSHRRPAPDDPASSPSSPTAASTSSTRPARCRAASTRSSSRGRRTRSSRSTRPTPIRIDPVGRVFEETAYGLEGIAGESRSGDANGQYIRVAAGGGTNTVTIPNGVPSQTGAGLEDAVGLTPFPILGSMPRSRTRRRRRSSPNSPCEQPGAAEPPGAASGAAPQQTHRRRARRPGSRCLRLGDAEGDPRRRAAAVRAHRRQQLAPLLKLAGGG